MAQKRAQRGFTLTELIVVVAVVAALVGLMFPSFHAVWRMGSSVGCLANLRSVAVGLRAYLDRNKDIMPVAAQMPSLQLNDDPSIAEVLEPYLGGTGALECPADTSRRYFQTEGSSYEYQCIYAGRSVEEGFLTRHLGAERTPVMNDYEPFHGRAGTPGGANYLFADGHVGDLD